MSRIYFHTLDETDAELRGSERAYMGGVITNLCASMFDPEWNRDKTALRMKREGYVHANGNPFTLPTVRIYALRYIIEHVDEAKHIMLEFYANYRMSASLDYVNKTIIKYAAEVIRKKEKLVNWALENNFYDEYKDFIDELYIEKAYLGYKRHVTA